MSMYPITSLPQQLQRHIVVDPVTECWTWTAYTSRGYPRVAIYDPVTKRTRQRRVHRLVWETLVGPVAPDLDIAHTEHDQSVATGVPCVAGDACPHRRCVNPDHLSVTTKAGNRASVWRAKGLMPPALRTECPAGHALTGENVVRTAKGGRQCRTCLNEKRRVWDGQKRERKRVAREAIRPTTCAREHDQIVHGEWVRTSGRGGGPGARWRCGLCRRLDAYDVARAELTRYEEVHR